MLLCYVFSSVEGYRISLLPRYIIWLKPIKYRRLMSLYAKLPARIGYSEWKTILSVMSNNICKSATSMQIYSGQLTKPHYNPVSLLGYL